MPSHDCARRADILHAPSGRASVQCFQTTRALLSLGSKCGTNEHACVKGPVQVRVTPPPVSLRDAYSAAVRGSTWRHIINGALCVELCVAAPRSRRDVGRRDARVPSADGQFAAATQHCAERARCPAAAPIRPGRGALSPAGRCEAGQLGARVGESCGNVCPVRPTLIERAHSPFRPSSLLLRSSSCSTGATSRSL